MNDSIEFKGYWFLPNKPNIEVVGVLRYIPNVSIMLELVGGFSENLKQLLSVDKEVELIQGYTSDAKKVTLVNCFPSSSINFAASFAITKYSCSYMIIGKHLHSFSDASFFKAKVYFAELTYWCLPGALEGNMVFDENRNMTSLNISFENFNDNNLEIIHQTQIDDNTNLLLKKCVDYKSSNYFLTPRIEQYTNLEIHKKEDSSITDFISNIFLYEQFLSLATLEVVECSKIIFYDKNLFRDYNGLKRYDKIELIYVQKGKHEKHTQTKRHNYLFVYDTIKNQYSMILQKWFAEKEEIAPIRAHLMESIKPKNVFSSVDFLIVVQAIEGYYTRFRKKDSLTNILKNIILEFSFVNKIKKDNLKIEEVRDSRHYYSHFMKKSEKPQAKEGLELYKITHKLRKLLICCLLDFKGFDKPQINDIFNSCHNKLLD